MVDTTQLFLRGLILGIPLAVLPGPFVDALITEARRRTYGACVTFLLIRGLIEGPLFFLLSMAVALGFGHWLQAQFGLALAALLLGLWGWHLIDRTGYISLRMDASYGRLHTAARQGALAQLLVHLSRTPWFWILWICLGLRCAVEIGSGTLDSGFGWVLFGWPVEWWVRAGVFALGYYIPAAIGALWVAYSLSHRARMREGDFFLLPNRPYRIVVSLGGTLLLLLGFSYGMRLLGTFVTIL